MKKLRLLLRAGIADSNGELAEHRYSTCDLEITDANPCFRICSDNFPPEIIGGEWLEWKEELP